MSLETEIKKFADAVIGLTAAIEANTKAAYALFERYQQHASVSQELIDQAAKVPFVVLDASTNQVVSEPAAPQPVAETPAAPQPVAETPAAPQPVAETPAAPTVTLAELQKLGKQLIDAGRTKELTDSVKALGHPAMSKMPVELYPQMLAKLQELIGGAE